MSCVARPYTKPTSIRPGFDMPMTLKRIPRLRHAGVLSGRAQDHRRIMPTPINKAPQACLPPRPQMPRNANGVVTSALIAFAGPAVNIAKTNDHQIAEPVPQITIDEPTVLIVLRIP